MTILVQPSLPRPLRSLQQGSWFKLICGASYEHLPAIRDLTLVYALVGADCIDVAADPAAVAAVQAGLKAAETWAVSSQGRANQGRPSQGRAVSVSESGAQTDGEMSRPWVMVSLNDGEDPHFRKAVFEGLSCPESCAQPCVPACPAEAILPQGPTAKPLAVESDRCYGCGRCLPVCPSQLITTQSLTRSVDAIAQALTGQFPQVLTRQSPQTPTEQSPQALTDPCALPAFAPPSAPPSIDALEIHTQIGRTVEFQALWQQLVPYIPALKLISISCPDGEGLIAYLQTLWALMAPLPIPLIWQTDGRPMSGDLGKGTTHATLKYAQKVLNARLPGHVQLAGGTNQHTVNKMKQLFLPQSSPTGLAGVAGIAYGSYARHLLMPLMADPAPLASRPRDLQRALELAYGLVSQLKGGSPLSVCERDPHAAHSVPAALPLPPL